MAWLQVHQSLRDHRKTLAAGRRLGVSPVQVAGHLLFLWLWALDNAPEGDLSGIDHDVLGAVAGWTGEGGEFIAALLGVGLLEEVEGALLIHDWQDYAGGLLERRQARAAAQRQRRRQRSPAPPAPRPPAARLAHPAGPVGSPALAPDQAPPAPAPPSVPSAPDCVPDQPPSAGPLPAPPVADPEPPSGTAEAAPSEPGSSNEAATKPLQSGAEADPKLPRVEKSKEDERKAPSLSPPPAHTHKIAAAGTPEGAGETPEGGAGLPRLAPGEFRLFWQLHPRPRARTLTALEWDRLVAGGVPPGQLVASAQTYAEALRAKRYRGREVPSEVFLRRHCWQRLTLAPP
ncbi:MAG: hypothetical protein ACYC4L_20995 [Chloroflexota bacterium]